MSISLGDFYLLRGERALVSIQNKHILQKDCTTTANCKKKTPKIMYELLLAGTQQWDTHSPPAVHRRIMNRNVISSRLQSQSCEDAIVSPITAPYLYVVIV